MSDLPEPKPIELNETEIRERRRKLIRSFLFLIAVYACIHKCVIPLILKTTHLSESPYARVDLWFLHPFILWALLRRYNAINGPVAFVCGAGVTYGLIEAYLMVTGQTVGWLAISRLVSSFPVAGCCVILLTYAPSARIFAVSWAGAIALGLYFVLSSWRPGLAPQAKLAPNPPMAKSFEESPVDCGASRIKLTPGEAPVQEMAVTLTVRDCGLSPKKVAMSHGKIRIENRLDQPFNAHLLYFVGGQKRQGWNRLVLAKKSLEETIEVPAGGVALLYSDSDPKAGIVAFFGRSLESEWQLQRIPISAKEIGP